MNCSPVNLGQGNFAFLCGSRRRRKPCTYCGAGADYQCDFPVMRDGKKTSCDLWLCGRCTLKGNNPEYDFCRPHHRLAAEAAQRRAARAKGA